MTFATPLADQVHREVAACIGCHDCLLACPLPEASLVGIADLNAAVRLPVLRSPNVIRFVTACTQCQRCVPACPADLSRADMVLFNKMKVEDTVPDHRLPIQAGEATVPSSFMLDDLTREVAALRLFAGVPRDDVRRLLLKVTLRRLSPGEVLCREGEYHDRLFVVLAGTLDQISGAVAATARGRVLALGPGAFSGEMAVMADQPEPFTLVARGDAVIVAAPKAAIHRLMHTAPAFRATMEALYARRAIFTYATRPGALGGLPGPAIEEILASAELASLAAGEVLFGEGSAPEAVYLVRTGFLRVTRRAADRSDGSDEVLVYFREGDLFGALPLLFGEPAHAFTVRAVHRAEVIRIPGDVFGRVVERHPEARALALSGALEAERTARLQGSGRREAPRPAEGSVARRLSWDVVVEHGLAEGREMLVVDQTLCTRCDGCVDACGRRHGMSRLELRGLQVEQMLFPTSCRHCDDPVCLLCSVEGIVRRPGGEIAIVADNCIGCGACADRCPYGNIRMHAVAPPRRGIVRRFLDYLRGPRDEDAAPQADADAPRRAVKCDLCEGHDDYACVTACPVGAAFRVDPDVFAGLRARERG